MAKPHWELGFVLSLLFLFMASLTMKRNREKGPKPHSQLGFVPPAERLNASQARRPASVLPAALAPASSDRVGEPHEKLSGAALHGLKPEAGRNGPTAAGRLLM